MNASPDPATVEIIRNRLLAAAEDMRVTLVRSAYTPVIFESEDCAVALLDRDAEVLAQSTGLPLFLGNIEQAVKAAVELRGGAATLRPGDVLCLNDSYIQGTHLPDFTTFAPVFAGDELVGHAVARAHMVDLAGLEPGGGMATTTIYHEGLRLGPVRIYADDAPVEDIFDVLQRNSREGDALVGDVHAMAAACRTGVQRLTTIVERWGVDVLDRARDEIFAHSDAASRAVISAVPDGVYRSSGFLDDDGVDAGRPVRIAVAITVDADTLDVDLEGSNPTVRGAINCGVAQTVSAVRVAVRLLLGGDRPPDGGTFRTLRVRVPEGCFLNASEPAACGNYAASAALLMDLVMRAFADVLPDRVCAGQFGDAISEFIGEDPRSNRRFMLGEAHAGGWGAGVGYDGADGTIDLTNGGFKNFSVELLEARHPIQIVEYGYRRGSAGAGAQRGGSGIVRTYRMQADDIALYLWLDRVATPAWGLAGGEPGASSYARLSTKDAGERLLHKAEGLVLDAGDEVTIYTSGGGGYGPPADRSAPDLARDAASGLAARPTQVAA
jgi:N-methylhydantoinase B